MIKLTEFLETIKLPNKKIQLINGQETIGIANMISPYIYRMEFFNTFQNEYELYSFLNKCQVYNFRKKLLNDEYVLQFHAGVVLPGISEKDEVMTIFYDAYLDEFSKEYPGF